MATIDTLIADVQTWTNMPSSVVTTAVAAECINAAMRRMTRKHSFSFQQLSVDLVIPGGTQNSVPLPPGFLEEIAVYSKDPSQTDPGTGLAPITRTLRSYWFAARYPLANIDPMFPQVAAPALRSAVTDIRYYFLWQNQLTIVPTPTQPLTLTLDYILTSDLQPALTPPDQNGFTVLYPDAVRNGALSECYRFLHDWTVSANYEQKFADDLAAVIVHDNAQNASGESRRRGK